MKQTNSKRLKKRTGISPVLKSGLGFTLIEVLVYLALFALIMVGLLASAFNIFQANDRTQTKIMVQEEGDFLLSKINWALTGATVVTVVSSPASLSITRANSPTSVVFDQNLKMNRGAGLVTLNNSNVTVSGLTYSDPFPGALVEPVTTSFTLGTKTTNGQVYSETFTTTKYLRK